MPLALLAVVAVARPARALLPSANASGEALYQRECAPCHGPAGHGDGPEAPTFRTTPRDLGDLARAEPVPRIVERVRRSRLRMLEIDEEVVAERRTRMVEELVGYLQRMPDVPWPQVRRGADVYAERCEKCHGPNGRPVTLTALQRGPVPSGPQPRPDFQKALGDAELIAIARGQGHPAVVGFAPVMREDDATSLLAYLRLLSNGFVWYSLWCAGCHGDDGRADGALASGIDLPPVVFDRAYLSAQSPAELRRKAMHLFTDVEPTAPHFVRNISEGQTRAVLTALRGLQAGEGAATPPPANVARSATAPPANVAVPVTAPPASASVADALPAATRAPAVASAATPPPPAMAVGIAGTAGAAAALTSQSTPVAAQIEPRSPAPAALTPAPAATATAAVTPRTTPARAAVARPQAKPTTKAQVKAKAKPKPKPTPRPKRTPKKAPVKQPRPSPSAVR